MEHGVGGATHSNVESHRIEECWPGGYAFRKNRLIPVTVILPGIGDNETGCLAEEFLSSPVCGHYCTVSRQGEADSLCKTIHRVGSEHSRAASASRAGRIFNFLDIRIAD